MAFGPRLPNGALDVRVPVIVEVLHEGHQLRSALGLLAAAERLDELD